MVESGLFCISMIVFLVSVLVVAIFITGRPKKGCELYNVDVNRFIPHIVQVMQYYGWKTIVNSKKRKITVIKNSLVAANIYLKPK